MADPKGALEAPKGTVPFGKGLVRTLLCRSWMFRLSSLSCSEASCIMKMRSVKQTGCPLKLAHWLVVISRIKIEVELQLKPAHLFVTLMISSFVDHMCIETCGRPIFPEENAPRPSLTTHNTAPPD